MATKTKPAPKPTKPKSMPKGKKGKAC